MKEHEIKQEGKCSLCNGKYTNYGNNPQPLKEYWQRCCDKCNFNKVIPARMHKQ